MCLGNSENWHKKKVFKTAKTVLNTFQKKVYLNESLPDGQNECGVMCVAWLMRSVIDLRFGLNNLRLFVEQNFGNGFAQFALSDDGSVCILREHDVELAGLGGEVNVGRSVVKRKVVFSIERLFALTFYVAKCRPTYGFGSRKREMYVDVAAVNFELLVFCLNQRGIGHVDIEFFAINGNASGRNLRKVVRLDVIKKLLEEWVQRFGALTGLKRLQNHID